jgi:thiamine biosynthesis lipoprotein
MLLVAMQGLGCTATSPGSFRRFEFARVRMGTEANITVWSTATPADVDAAANAAFERIAEIEEATSDWLVHGQVAELRTASPNTPIRLNGDLLLAMRQSEPLVELTNGAFDPACGRLTMMWRAARSAGVPPSQARVTQAAASSGWERLHFNSEMGTITPEHPVPWLDFGGVAKGLAADKALLVLRDHGMGRAMVNIGGDIATGNGPPEQAGWFIDRPVQSGSKNLQGYVVSRMGIATSGSTYQHLAHDGKVLSHVLDPRNGAAVEHTDRFTVTAPTAAEADALASAACVVGARQLRSQLQATGSRYGIDVTP